MPKADRTWEHWNCGPGGQCRSSRSEPGAVMFGTKQNLPQKCLPGHRTALPSCLSLGLPGWLTAFCSHSLFLVRCERKGWLSADQAVVVLQPQVTLCAPRLEFQVPSPSGWLPRECPAQALGWAYVRVWGLAHGEAHPAPWNIH